jgi:hypothetical protein
MQLTKKVQVILMMIAALMMANAASARVLSMTGSWYMNRGPLVDIPAKGGAVPCGTVPTPGGGTAMIGGTGLENGCVGGLRPANGGIPGNGQLQVNGSNPANFTIEPDSFSIFPGEPWVVAVAVAPTVQQLASTFTFMGPGRVAPSGPNASGNPSAAAFMASAPTNDPGQVGRAGANFSWCPGGGAASSGLGAGVSACTAPASATPAAGNWNGRISYTAGANKFGGTMAMMMGGIGYVSVVINAIPGFPAAIVHQQVGAGVGVQRAQVQGAAYNFLNFNNFPAAPAYSTFMTATPCTNPLPALPAGCGVITGQGAAVFGGAPIIPADSQLNFGMPWTTGTVKVSNTGMNGTKPATTVLSAMGYDNRTALGAGKITLVAGGTTHRMTKATAGSAANPQNYSALDVVNLNIGQSAVPAMSPMGLATAAVLMMLAVGYAFRRRLVTNE